MYKVLIVDDEALVRAGLKTTIDWENLGFVVIADAANGELGFEEYLKSEPDVVFTDIRMPKKDGIWLVQKIKEHNAEVKILVLTCYDEFSYAREALKAGAGDYILKSEVEDEELVEIMKKIKTSLDYSTRTGADGYEMNVNHTSIRTHLFDYYIQCGFCENSETSEMRQKIGYTLDNKKTAFVYINIPSSFVHLTQVLLNLFFQYLDEKKIDYLYRETELGYRVLLSSDALEEDDIKKALLNLNKSSIQYFDKALQFVYTPVYDEVEGLKKYYESFSQSTSIFFYVLLTHFYIVRSDEVQIKEIEITDVVKKYRKEFVAIVNDGDMEEAKLLLSEIKEEAKGQKYKPKSIRIVFSNLINELFEHFKGALVEDSQLKRHETYHEEMMQSKTLDELIQRYTKFLIVLMNVVNKSNIGHSKLLIQRVLDYIEEHYVEGVSLENVASYMNLSKHYLSTLFKKETGENMTTYINRKKIERAKVLLMNPEYRIQDVVEKVGFSNQQYFSKMFKRITGMTVMEYKEKRRDK